MTESPEIAALAKVVSEGLGRDHRVAQGLLMAARDMFREPDFYNVGGFAADEFWRHFAPHRILADVAGRRTLLDGALGWEHYEHGEDEWHSCQAHPGRIKLWPTEPRDCRCTRDARVRGVLTALAAPYLTTATAPPTGRRPMWTPTSLS